MIDNTVTDKCIKVVSSCRTPEHFEIAINYIGIAHDKKYINLGQYDVLNRLICNNSNCFLWPHIK